MAWLSQQGIEFDERNVSENPAYREELVKRGYTSVPVTIIGDEVILGFDQERLKQILKL